MMDFYKRLFKTKKTREVDSMVDFNGDYADVYGCLIKGPVDIGHVYGWEYRCLVLAAQEVGLTQQEFNDYINARPEKFRLESRSENRSHKNEMPGVDKIQPIINDMKTFLMEENDMKQENLNNILRFEKLYEQDPDLRVTGANSEGNMNLLIETFFIKKELDILEASPKEKWNWLHRCNLDCYNPSPLPVVEFYIQHGVEVNAQDMYGMTPLHYAMRARNAEAAIALLNAGADPNIPDRDNVIALSNIGGMPEELGLLKLMLEKGGNVHYHNGQHEVLEGFKKYLGNKPLFIPVIKLMEEYA